jgi:hypothetical protein
MHSDNSPNFMIYIQQSVERCKHVKSQATTVYFKLGKLRQVSTYVQHVWGIIGHVTAEAGNTVGTDGAPPQKLHMPPLRFRVSEDAWDLI